MSYISPIKLNTIPDMEEGWTDKIAKYIAGETDKLVLESCVKVACDVDEEELLKALQYDRGQYEKGYADGKRDAASPWHRVEEPPKEERRTYLVYTDTGYMCSCRWTNNVYGLGESDRWGWCFADIPQFQEVVYWMSIEPPKEDA